MNLYDKIQSLRLAAALTYDRARAKDLREEEVADEVFPIRERLKKTIHDAVNHRVEEAHLAIQLLEGDARNHEIAIEVLRQKAEESRQYIRMVQSELIARCDREAQDSIRDGDYLVTCVETATGPKVVMR